jgi:hypothetical protein
VHRAKSRRHRGRGGSHPPRRSSVNPKSPGLHREPALLTEAGLTPAETIRAATLDAARFLTQNNDPDFGSVAVGKRADLLLVDGDPRTDVAVLSRIRSVLLGARSHQRGPLTRRYLSPGIEPVPPAAETS